MSDWDKSERRFKWFFRAIMGFVILVFLLVIVGWVGVIKWVHSGDARKEVHQELKEVVKIIKDTERD